MRSHDFRSRNWKTLPTIYAVWVCCCVIAFGVWIVGGWVLNFVCRGMNCRDAIAGIPMLIILMLGGTVFGLLSGTVYAPMRLCAGSGKLKNVIVTVLAGSLSGCIPGVLFDWFGLPQKEGLIIGLVLGATAGVVSVLWERIPGKNSSAKNSE